MSDTGPGDKSEDEPKSVEELEAELEKVKGDIAHATTEADAPDSFAEPGVESYEEFFGDE